MEKKILRLFFMKPLQTFGLVDFASPLFLDAVREVRKYSSRDLGVDAKLQPNMFDHMHMKLFRAQRNLYISGFSVFLWL